MTENEFANMTPRRIVLTPAQFEKFEELLILKPKDMPKLQSLMNQPVVWAEEPCA
jgi:hypothetical protein